MTTWTEAAAALRRGEAVLLPTDTIYGVAALPSLPGATDALFELKGRDRQQPLAVLVANAEQARSLCEPWGQRGDRLAARFWPGPLTLVCRRGEAASQLELGGDAHTIGVRCPDHQDLQRLASELGPLATTSANPSGAVTPPDLSAAAAGLLGPVGHMVDGGRLGGQASTVVDLTSPDLVILREGAIAAVDIAMVVFG